jgi:hypothetical protein
MGGVCEAAGGEGVGRQKKAEITRQESLRNGYAREKQEADARGEETDNNDGTPTATREIAKWAEQP